jgi:ElaB/YqjD/DUF883 family membrane-anchored ribosome-binding protein
MMSHPLTPNLSDLTDAELQNKIQQLSKRLSQSYRLGGHHLQSQINLMLEDYKAEIHKRNQDKIQKTKQAAEKAGKNFGDSIDIT